LANISVNVVVVAAPSRYRTCPVAVTGWRLAQDTLERVAEGAF